MSDTTPETLVATAHTAFLFLEHDPTYAADLFRHLRRDVAEGGGDSAHYVLLSAMAILHYSLELEPKEDALALLDEAIEIAEAVGYPRYWDYRNRILMLLDLGRTADARTTAEELVNSAAENVLDRAQGLAMLAVTHLIAGELEPALACNRDSARLFVEAGDFGTAADAEYDRATVTVLLGRSDLAGEALATVEHLHQLVGLPPPATDDPALAARVAGDLEHWPDFELCMRNWLNELADDDDQRSKWLRGDSMALSHAVMLLTPTIHWLLAQHRNPEAARLAAATDMTLAAAVNSDWARLGEEQRLRAAASKTDLDMAADVPGNLEELYWAIASCFETSE